MKKMLSLVLALLMMAAMLPAALAEMDVLNDPDFDLSGNLPILKDPAKMPEITILFREFAESKTPIGETVQVARFLEDTGLSFKWESVPSEGYDEKLNLMLSSYDLPDVIWTPVNDNTVVQYMGQDVFLPTNDLIDQYIPNLKSILDENPEFKEIATAPDGNLYGFPYIVQMRGLILSPGPIMINKDWLDKVGLEVPTTLDEYHAALKAFEEFGDLNENGVDDEFAFAASFANPGGFGSDKVFNQLTGCFGQANAASGDMRDNLAVVDGKVIYSGAHEAYKETAKFFRQMQEEGLIDPDSFANDAKVWQDKLRQDTALIGSFGVWSPETTVTDPAVRSQYVVLPRLEGLNGKSGFALNATEVQNKCHLAITTACEYPELVAAFINYLYTPEISVTSIWGAEGEGWMFHKDENGMLCYNVDENNDIILVDGMESFWTIRCNSGPVESGAVLNKYYGTVCEYAWDAVTLREGQELAGSNEILAEYQVIPPTYLDPEVSARAVQLNTELTNILNSYTMQWVMDGNIDETWDQYQQDLKDAGVEEFVALFQNVMDTMGNQ